MTKQEIADIEKDYQRHANTKAGKRILRLIQYVRELEQTIAGFRTRMMGKGK
ncbi:MAG: hypothetical protein WC527_09080 [Candidatus Margulisiibacteriota bacterium]